MTVSRRRGLSEMYWENLLVIASSKEILSLNFGAKREIDGSVPKLSCQSAVA